MPSKNGFGNSRTPLAKKAQYGVDQKNPITMKASPSKTKLGRWLMGRKKHETVDGETVITDKHNKVVKTKDAQGKKTKYKKGNRPNAVVFNWGENSKNTKVQYNK